MFVKFRMRHMKKDLLILLGFLAFAAIAAVAARLLPHPANFTPMGALSLFAGAYFARYSSIWKQGGIRAYWLGDFNKKKSFHGVGWKSCGSSSLFPRDKRRSLGVFQYVSCNIWRIDGVIHPCFALLSVYSLGRCIVCRCIFWRV